MSINGKIKTNYVTVNMALIIFNFFFRIIIKNFNFAIVIILDSTQPNPKCFRFYDQSDFKE